MVVVRIMSDLIFISDRYFSLDEKIVILTMLNIF